MTNPAKGTGRITPDILQMLDAIYIPEWQVISETFILNDIYSFAGQISRFAREYSLPQLLDWGDSLLAASDACDIMLIARTLESFSALVEDLNSHDIVEDNNRKRSFHSD